LKNPALALRTEWHIDGTGHLEGDMKKRAHQRASVGWPGIGIVSHAMPVKRSSKSGILKFAAKTTHFPDAPASTPFLAQRLKCFAVARFGAAPVFL
jgi:hypothetical protein